MECGSLVGSSWPRRSLQRLTAIVIPSEARDLLLVSPRHVVKPKTVPVISPERFFFAHAKVGWAAVIAAGSGDGGNSSNSNRVSPLWHCVVRPWQATSLRLNSVEFSWAETFTAPRPCCGRRRQSKIRYLRPAAATTSGAPSDSGSPSCACRSNPSRPG